MNRSSHPDRLARLDTGTLRVKLGFAISTMKYAQNHRFAIGALAEKYAIEAELKKRGLR